MKDPALTVQFAGYAPVHFLCFRPIFEALRKIPGCEIALSGGLRSEHEGGWLYDLEGLYNPLNVPAELLVPVEELAQRRFDVAFGAQTNLICPHTAERRVQIFHGISFRNRAVRPENMGCDHYFLVGPYMHRRFLEAGLLREDDPRAVKVGFPKTDALLDGSLDRQALLARFGFDGTRPVVLYAPTGQKGNSLETMGEEVLELLVAADACDVLVKLHDHPKRVIDWKSRLSRFESPHFKVSDELDVIPQLFLADLLITDASSVSSEYSLLDRPMVFLDVPKLIEKARAKDNSQVDLETWGREGGPIAHSPEEALEMVASGLDRPSEYSSVRQAMARDLFYNPGSATENAADWVTANLVSSRAAVAV